MELINVETESKYKVSIFIYPDNYNDNYANWIGEYTCGSIFCRGVSASLKSKVNYISTSSENLPKYDKPINNEEQKRITITYPVYGYQGLREDTITDIINTLNTSDQAICECDCGCDCDLCDKPQYNYTLEEICQKCINNFNDYKKNKKEIIEELKIVNAVCNQYSVRQEWI